MHVRCVSAGLWAGGCVAPSWLARSQPLFFRHKNTRLTTEPDHKADVFLVFFSFFFLVFYILHLASPLLHHQQGADGTEGQTPPSVAMAVPSTLSRKFASDHRVYAHLYWMTHPYPVHLSTSIYRCKAISVLLHFFHPIIYLSLIISSIQSSTLA